MLVKGNQYLYVFVVKAGSDRLGCKRVVLEIAEGKVLKKYRLVAMVQAVQTDERT